LQPVEIHNQTSELAIIGRIPKIQETSHSRHSPHGKA
jgi:hypothetical protein